MKTTFRFFIILLMAITSTLSLAQEKNSYLRVHGGLSLGVAKSAQDGTNLVELRNPENMQVISMTETGLYDTFGAGGKAGIAFGRMLNRVVGFELGLNYFQGFDQLRERHVVELSSVPGAFNFEQTAFARALALTPSIVFTAGKETGLNPYARFGLVVPVWGDLQVSTQIEDPFGMIDANLRGMNASYDRHDVIHPVKPQLGYEAAFGLDFPVGNRLKVFGEVDFRMITVDGDNRETTRFDVRVGNEQIRRLQDFPIGITQSNYHERITNSSNVRHLSDGRPNPNFDASKPADELKSFANLNAFGFNFGIRYRL